MMRCPVDLEIYRRPHPISGDIGDRHNGFLFIPRRALAIVFSAGGGWEHASVSIADRCPTWEEMDWVRRKLWEASDTVMQLHPPISENISLHPYCLHLWAPMWSPNGVQIPRPPAYMVA